VLLYFGVICSGAKFDFLSVGPKEKFYGESNGLRFAPRLEAPHAVHENSRWEYQRSEQVLVRCSASRIATLCRRALHATVPFIHLSIHSHIHSFTHTHLAANDVVL